MTPITRALSAALLHFVWQGLMVTILLWLALFLLRKRSASLRYAASCSELVLLAVLPAITTWAFFDQHRVAALPGAALLMDTLPAAAPAPSGGRLDWLALAQAWAVPVWSLGVLFFSLRMGWGCTQIATLRRAGEAADAQLRSAFERLAARMGVTRPVRLLLSTATDGPSLTGWLRPVVLLPVSALAGLTPDQLEVVLAHELAHIRRHDYLVNLLQMAAETLLFYHPAVWWISGRIRHERELCCDDMAVGTCGQALTYARALTALEKMRSPRPALALGSTDGPLFYRIRRLVMGGGEYGPSKLSGTVALTLGLACLALYVNWARAQEPPRAVAVRAGGMQDDSEGVTVDTAGALVLHRPSVEYPGRLIEKHVEGTVAVEATLDAAGNVTDAHVLSGPDELRRVALSSVLNWHFVPAAERHTRVVQISFQVPATPSRPVLEASATIASDGRLPETRGSRGEAEAAELRLREQETQLKLREQTATTGRNQTVMSADFLREYVQYVERLMALQRGNGASVEQIGQLRDQLEELKRRLENAQVVSADSERLQRQIEEREAELEQLRSTLEGRGSTGDNAEARVQSDRALLRLAQAQAELRARAAAEQRGRMEDPVRGRLAAIEIRGLSEEPGNDLLSRLPVREGDILTPQSMEAASRVIRQFDEHLEFNYRPGPEGTVLRIHPAGRAAGPLLLRK